MRRILLVVLSLIPVALFGQSAVYGVVLDSLTQEPMPSATVYVNGTTHGTTTDNDGRFELKNVTFPATIVFSFVGYQPQAHDFTRNPGNLTIRLRTNDELPEIEVSGKANKIKKADLDYFKDMFLGKDRWGKRATIRNENAIMVDNSYDTTSYTIETMTFNLAVRNEIKDVGRTFKAWTGEPLIIDMPLLGYEVYVDLVKFTVVENDAHIQSDMLGYFYYKPYEHLSKRQAQSIEENRRRAYYGSSQHLLRSVADNRLRENGYVLSIPDKVVKGRKTISTYMPVDMDKYSDYSADMIRIHGLKDRKLRIRYYHKSDGSPMNFKEKSRGINRYSESWATLLNDTCAFLKDGIVADNNMLFTGDMSKRRVGSFLPDDYFPPGDSVGIRPVESVDYDAELMRFADNIKEFNSLFPQEKVYLEFDNTAYFQGENIWFKAFVTHATTLERAPSGVLYVDFLAPTGQLILQQKLKIEAGQADGAIPLLDAGTFQTREKYGIRAYPSGFYEIRAYTQNMLDFSPDAIFSRVIPVYTQPKFEGEYDRSHVISNMDNPLVEKIRGESNPKYGRINVAFFPEGGDIVKGLPCRVAFKATGSDAFGLDGTLKVEGLWDSIHTVHDGMGSFIITPDGNETAEFITSDDDIGQFNLPKALKSGYSMMADMMTDSRMQVNIWRTPDRVGEQTALAVTCRGQVVYFEEIRVVDNARLDIDCSCWPVGVCRITLFDRNGMILSSRSIFHNNNALRSPVIAIKTDSMSRQSCEREILEFTLTDQAGNPFRDRFCLSVRDATDYGGGQTDNLQTNLLLSSDLRGYIHDPAWYLEADDDEHRDALNLLTMVQGWERYEWQTMVGLKDFEERYRVEEGLTMNGWILSYGRRQPVSDIGVYASIIPEDDKTLFESFDYQTDSTGYFGFDLSDFYGKGKFTINLMSTRRDGDSKYEKSKRIRFERADRPAPRTFWRQETDLTHNNHGMYEYKADYTDIDLTDAQRRKLGRMIDDVEIEDEAGKKRFVDYDTFTSFEAEEDAELELDQGEFTTDLRGYFLERGIRFVEDIDDDAEDSEEENGGKEGDKGYIYEKDILPYFYIHNLNKTLVNKPFDNAMEIDMIDVKSIIIFDKPMYPRDFVDYIPLDVEYYRKHVDAPIRAGKYSGESDGEFDFFSWVATSWERYYLVDVQIKEDRELLFYNEITNLGRRTTTVKGFTRPVQFYSPQYPDGPIEGSPDYRRTLYWNPNVITDENGHARVEFYNNSFTRKFTINAAGITASGIPYILNQNW